MSLTNFISLLGTAGSNVLKPKTHLPFSKTSGATIGTGTQIGFFRIQDNGTLMFVGNDDPITASFENFQNILYGYSPTKNQAVLWNKSGQFYSGVYTYRRHMIAYDMSDPDNPVRVTNSTQNNSTGDNKVVPSISTEQVNATGVGANAFFFANAVWRGNSTREPVQYVGNGSANQYGPIQYQGSSISGSGITGSTPLLYDEDAGLFFAQINNSSGAPSYATYVADSVTRNSNFRFSPSNYDASPAGIDVKRKLLFVQSNATNAGVNRSYQKTVYCLDYSNYPTVTLRSHVDIGPANFQTSPPRVMVHDDKFQYLLNIYATNQGSPQSYNPGYYLVDTSDPDNITQRTAGRIPGGVDTRNFDYDPAQNTGYFFGDNNSSPGNFVHKFVISASGIGFSMNVATDPTSTKDPSDYLSSATLYNATLLYG